MTRISLAEVNSLDEEQFVWVFKNVIELHEAAAKRVQDKRPFQTLPDLCAAFHKYLDDLPVEEKLLILKLHPDLAGRLAAQGEITAESIREQQSAGLDTLSKEQKSIIDVSNERYKSKFGFPFIICARENKVQAIIEGLQKRYINTREEEIENGINEVKKICRLRIIDIVQI